MARLLGAMGMRGDVRLGSGRARNDLVTGLVEGEVLASVRCVVRRWIGLGTVRVCLPAGGRRGDDLWGDVRFGLESANGLGVVDLLLFGSSKVKCDGLFGAFLTSSFSLMGRESFTVWAFSLSSAPKRNGLGIVNRLFLTGDVGDIKPLFATPDMDDRPTGGLCEISGIALALKLVSGFSSSTDTLRTLVSDNRRNGFGVVTRLFAIFGTPTYPPAPIPPFPFFDMTPGPIGLALNGTGSRPPPASPWFGVSLCFIIWFSLFSSSRPLGSFTRVWDSFGALGTVSFRSTQSDSFGSDDISTSRGSIILSLLPREEYDRSPCFDCVRSFGPLGTVNVLGAFSGLGSGGAGLGGSTRRPTEE